MKKSNMTIVLSDDAKRIVKEDSELFGGNISAYITHLILDARKNKNFNSDFATWSLKNNNSPNVNGSENVVATGKSKVKQKTQK